MSENPRKSKQAEPAPEPPAGGEPEAPVDMNPWPTSPSSADMLDGIRRRMREARKKKSEKILPFGTT